MGEQVDDKKTPGVGAAASVGSPPVPLTGDPLLLWEGRLAFDERDGERKPFSEIGTENVFRDLTLFEVARGLRDAGAGRRAVVQAIKEMDTALGYRKSPVGPSDGEYKRIARPLFVEPTVKGVRRYTAKELHDMAKVGGVEVEYLPILGRTDVKGFIEGQSHLVSSYPKTGKTTFLSEQSIEWARMGYKVGYYSEEPLSIWATRIGELSTAPDGFSVLPMLGATYDDLLHEVEVSDDDIVIIDTTKLLKIEDTSNDAKVDAALTPLIAACRRREATLIFLHHERKSGGKDGRGITGSHAYLALVDVSLEVDRVPSRPNRRKVTGLARLVDMPEFIYEMTDEGMKYIGETADADLDALKVRLFGVTPIGTKEWATKRELIEAAGEPTPSPTQADSALGLLVEAGEVEREPKETKPGATYRYRRPM